MLTTPPDPGNGTPKDFRARDLKLARKVERIRAELSISHSDWADFLHLTEREYRKMRAGRSALSALSLFHLSERLSLDPIALESGKIDYVALVQGYFGNRSYLSPDFRVAASSRKFTAVNTLAFVEKFRGPHLRIAANRHFQIHEDFWSDWKDPVSDKINIRFLGEFWRFLRKRGLTDDDFRSIGFHSIVTHQNTHIGKTFSSFEKPREVYECLFSDFMENFEKNHFYRITRLTDEICIVESRSNPDIAEALQARQTGSLEGCQFKIGLIQSLPTFIGGTAAAVHETHCVHRGDAVCRFYCDFSKVQTKDGARRRLSLIR